MNGFIYSLVLSDCVPYMEARKTGLSNIGEEASGTVKNCCDSTRQRPRHQRLQDLNLKQNILQFTINGKSAKPIE